MHVRLRVRLTREYECERRGDGGAIHHRHLSWLRGCEPARPEGQRARRAWCAAAGFPSAARRRGLWRGGTGGWCLRRKRRQRTGAAPRQHIHLGRSHVPRRDARRHRLAALRLFWSRHRLGVGRRNWRPVLRMIVRRGRLRLAKRRVFGIRCAAGRRPRHADVGEQEHDEESHDSASHTGQPSRASRYMAIASMMAPPPRSRVLPSGRSAVFPAEPPKHS